MRIHTAEEGLQQIEYNIVMALMLWRFGEKRRAMGRKEDVPSLAAIK